MIEDPHLLYALAREGLWALIHTSSLSSPECRCIIEVEPRPASGGNCEALERLLAQQLRRETPAPRGSYFSVEVHLVLVLGVPSVALLLGFVCGAGFARRRAPSVIAAEHGGAGRASSGTPPSAAAGGGGGFKGRRGIYLTEGGCDGVSPLR